MIIVRREITCINKSDRYSPHDRITHVGGVYAGSRWKMTQADVIRAIDSRTMEFYVTKNSKFVKVIVATNMGNKYIKTENDGDHPNNLLSLEECP